MIQLSNNIIANSLCVSIGVATKDEIDDINIHHATLLSMKRAVDNLRIIPDIIYFKPVIEGAGNMSNLRKDIKEQGGENREEKNEKKEKENEKLSEEKDEKKVDKKGFEDPADSDESDFENLVS